MTGRFADMGFDELLNKDGHVCACGRRHDTQLRFLRIGSGAINALPEALASAGSRKPFIIMDENTRRAAGDRVLSILNTAGTPHSEFCFSGSDELFPDERATGAAAMAFDPSCDSVMCVGSGVLNDISKVLAHATGRRSVAVATAPSMDGYASDSASMIQNKVKVSLYVACPVAIIADTDILAKAPERMLRAGLGDMLAKYVSLCEWRISAIVKGEYYCENIAGLMRESLRRLTENSSGLLRREPEAIEAVTRGLILSGVAMSFAKISRPASGLEHYFSHLWEMFSLQGRAPMSLHGEQVGVGTAITLSLYEHIKNETPNREAALDYVSRFDRSKWEAQMRDIFGAAADEVIALEDRVHKNDPAAHAERLDRLVNNWQEIRDIIKSELPKAGTVQDNMERLGMATKPGQLGLTNKDTLDAYFGSREIRDKYLTSSMLWDLGLLERYAEYIKG